MLYQLSYRGTGSGRRSIGHASPSLKRARRALMDLWETVSSAGQASVRLARPPRRYARARTMRAMASAPVSSAVISARMPQNQAIFDRCSSPATSPAPQPSVNSP